jgi:hypothetical protein
MGFFSKRRYDPNDSEYDGGGGSTIWSTSCAQDPRFNLSGRSYGVISSGSEIDKAVRAKQAELGLSDEYMASLTIEMGAAKP